MNQGFGLSAPASSVLDPSARPSSCRAGSSAVIALTRLLAPCPCVMPQFGFEVNVLVGSRARFGRCCSCGAALPALGELPCWAQSPCDNSRFRGSPSVPQLALPMPIGSQRRAASARLNERKCRAPATTISAMTSCRPRCVEVPCGWSGRATTACRPAAEKRQIHRVGWPLSRSKSGGRVVQ
jgi:hypothetical protein